MPATPMLAAWLRTLWDIAPTLHPLSDGQMPFLDPHGVHLPMAGDTALAAAAHAGAHLVFSRPGAPLAGLRPTTQRIAGLLEDARVEWLAGRELPGLRRLWATRHTATPEDGDGGEALLRRLARALADDAYADPHPWVVKGRRLMFLDDGQQVLALRQFDAVRQAASRLGNDLGQMRLPLNVRDPRPVADYRDDNRWLWEADVSPVDATPTPGHGEAPPRPVAAALETTERHHYPEWDHRIARHRPDWATVLEAPAPAGEIPLADGTHAALRRRLGSVLHPHGRDRRRLRRQADGDRLDVDALVRAWADRRAGRGIDPRVHLRAVPRARRGDVLLMVDTSASSADPVVPGGPPVLEAACLAARLCGEALQAAGHGCAIHAFRSDGRTAVQVLRVKGFDEPMAPAGLARLAALRSGWSTRLGAAIRHGTRRLLERAPRMRHLVLITDGEPHDTDVFEPRYLADDARVAVREARRQGVGVFCFGLRPSGQAVLRHVFGRDRHRDVPRPDDLPEALARLCL